MAESVNTARIRHIPVYAGGNMWRFKIISVLSIVFGVLLFTAGASWDWNNTTSKTSTITFVPRTNVSDEIPSIEVVVTSSPDAQASNLTAVVPPYVILSSTLGSWQASPQQDEMRVSIETIDGSYSESVALRLTGRILLPVSYAD